MKKLFVAIVSLTLASCASAGTEVSPSKVGQFQRGVTTLPEVIAALGEPTNLTSNADGKKIAVYSYAQTRIRPETFIPVVGSFVGGADTKATAVAFTFGPDNKLIDYSTSISNAGAGLGLAAK